MQARLHEAGLGTWEAMQRHLQRGMSGGLRGLQPVLVRRLLRPQLLHVERTRVRSSSSARKWKFVRAGPSQSGRAFRVSEEFLRAGVRLAALRSLL